MTERHNHPRLHTLYNKGMGAAQENRNFIIKKLSDYLEVPNNLLLSLSLSHRRTVAYLHAKTLYFITRATRASISYIPYSKRAKPNFLCPILYILLRSLVI